MKPHGIYHLWNMIHYGGPEIQRQQWAWCSLLHRCHFWRKSFSKNFSAPEHYLWFAMGQEKFGPLYVTNHT